MTPLDYALFGLYMAGLLAIGFFFMRRNRTHEDYFVGGRSMSASHIGLSIVATDVGGGFSIGLGGLGYAIGFSGSWLLFTGLLGAWLSAVFIIPRIKRIDRREKLLTYPDFLRWRYGPRVAVLAAVISGLGYLGFTAAQVLAGAKLMAGTIMPDTVLGLDSLTFSLYAIGLIIIAYTVMGGLKAVIYTDTVQWIVLLAGLILCAAPLALSHIGGWAALRGKLDPSFFSLTALSPVKFINWMITIVPIWLVGMTLYQRMFACRNEREARKAWFIAGIFEYPVMAFTGVFLGVCGRALFADIEAEMAIPLLIKTVVPAGLLGVVVASYFSAVMSTADSCLMASSGHLVSDLVQRFRRTPLSRRGLMALSQGGTLGLGLLAILLAGRFTTVLDGILYAYTFMVSGLFVPTLGAYFWKRGSSAGALAGMVAGGTAALVLETGGWVLPLGLDASFYGLAVSAAAFVGISLWKPDRARGAAAAMAGPDRTEAIDGGFVQHGPYNRRVYLMRMERGAADRIVPALDRLAARRGYTKIFAKAPDADAPRFLAAGYREEARIPGYFRDGGAVVFLGRYPDPARADDPRLPEIERLASSCRALAIRPAAPWPAGIALAEAGAGDFADLAALYRDTFESYPFPISDPRFLARSASDSTRYFLARENGVLVAASSAEMNRADGCAEMTDFATRPAFRGRGLAQALLRHMERAVPADGIRMAYTIARALEPGMNRTFARCGYAFGGTLINNTQIGGAIESMNVWYKPLDR